MDYCMECGGHGFPNEVCPSCGKEPENLHIARLTEPEMEEFEKNAEKILIPKQYIGLNWSSDMFWMNNPKYISTVNNKAHKDPLLVTTMEKLEKIHGFFTHVGVPAVSAIIVMPPNMGKMVFAYSCMQQALAKGFTVAPIFDTIEVYSMMGAAMKNPNYKLYGEITFDDYIMRQVMFITVTKTPHRKDAHYVIRDIMDKRARKGLSTFILSEFGIEEIASNDSTGYMLRMLSPTLQGQNILKVPIEISYKEPEYIRVRGGHDYAK